MASLQGQWVDKTIRSAVVVGLETLELTGFLAVRTRDGLTSGVSGETIQTTIHDEGLQPVFRRKKLEVKSSLACQFLRYGFVQINGNLHCLALCCHHRAAIEVVIVVAHRNLDAAIFFVDLTARHLGHKIPLLGCVVQADGAALH